MKRLNQNRLHKFIGYIGSYLENTYVELLNGIILLVLYVPTLLVGDKVVGYTAFSVYKVVWNVAFISLIVYRSFHVLKKYRLARKAARSGTFWGATKRYHATIAKIDEDLKDTNGDNLTDESPSTKNKLESVARMAHEAWDFENNVEQLSLDKRREYMTRLYSLNDQAFSLLMKATTEIGYISVLPMSNANHFAGLKSQYDFDETDISKTPTNLVYIQAVYKRPTYRDDGLYYDLLIQSLLKKISQCIADSHRAILYAEQFTLDGEWLLRKMGFRRTQRVSAGKEKPIWELSLNMESQMDEWKVNNNACLTIGAIRKLRQA